MVMVLGTYFNILNYSVKCRDACKLYSLKKLNYVPGLIPGAEESLLAHITTTMMIIADLRIEECGNLMNLKDGDDFGQVD